MRQQLGFAPVTLLTALAVLEISDRLQQVLPGVNIARACVCCFVWGFSLSWLSFIAAPLQWNDCVAPISTCAVYASASVVQLACH
jgi:hypothetical protein